MLNIIASFLNPSGNAPDFEKYREVNPDYLLEIVKYVQDADLMFSAEFLEGKCTIQSIIENEIGRPMEQSEKIELLHCFAEYHMTRARTTEREMAMDKLFLMKFAIPKVTKLAEINYCLGLIHALNISFRYGHRIIWKQYHHT